MPNWCKGTLKVRGEAEDIERFIRDGIVIGTYDKDYRIIESKPEYDEWGNLENLDDRSWIHVKGTSRGFLEDFDFICAEDCFFSATYKQTWNIKEEQLAEIARKYHLKMRIQAFELGCEFSRLVEVNENGGIVINQTIFYGDYFWECPCPMVGG